VSGGPEPLIQLDGVNKHYDGAQALRDASFSVAKGEVHALVGENGAGKSTLSKIIAGAVQPDAATVRWRGEPVRISSPIAAQRLGIGIVFQELDLFPNLSIAENIVIGNVRMERSPWVNRKELSRFCAAHLEQVGLAASPWTLVRDLPIAHMQLVAIARALSFDARLILMDEPTSSLADDAVDRLFALIRRLRSAGVSVVYVSHKMKEIFEIADRITVLRDGSTIGTRNAADTNIDEIIGMMVGRAIGSESLAPSGPPGEVVLSAAGVTTQKLRGVTFDLHRGEILGVAGLVGAGRSELGAALFGLDPIRGGSVHLNGREFHPRSPADAIRRRFGLLPEDRKLQGLMMQMSVLENTSIAILGRLARWSFLSHSREKGVAMPVLQRMALKSASPEAGVSSLSGGNQQKVLLAKWLLTNPDVLFLDDPTRGIDVGAKRDIYHIIQDLAGQGKGVLFVSSELPELLQCCHRILVLREGRNMGIVDARTATQEQIMKLATAEPVAA